LEAIESWRRVFWAFAFAWRLFVGRFDPHKNRGKVRLLHQPQELIIVRQVDRGLGGELERKAIVSLPLDQPGQNF
jgi:hypothetical protein